jgi:hypothetical protein
MDKKGSRKRAQPQQLQQPGSGSTVGVQCKCTCARKIHQL